MKNRLLRHFVLVGLAVGGTTAGAATRSESRPAEANIAQRVDKSLADEIGFATPEVKEQLAQATDDQAFLRRVYLDVAGTLPTPDDIMLFMLDPSTDKRAKLVERLLDDPRYGANWARYWRDVMFYRRSSERALIGYGVSERFLTEAFNRNDGWDKIARAFIEATGDISQNGETSLFMSQEAETSNIAAETSRVFMGVQIACAQCHDHPSDHWKRTDFHEFAAFFPRVGLRPIRVDGKQRGFEITSVNTAGGFYRPGGVQRGALEHYMPDLKNPTSKGTLIEPKFFATGDSLPTGTADLERRGKLADWITSKENPWFAKAVVNRLWAELVGEGFQNPVDDLSVDRPCSASKTFELLATEFAVHDYDVKWLFRTIMATDAYGRESRPRRNANQKPFLANCSYRLRSDVVYDCVMQALAISQSSLTAGGGTPGGAVFRYINGPRYQFSQTFGYDPSVRRETVAGSIPQALALMNSTQFASAIRNLLSQPAISIATNGTGDVEQAVVELYLRVLAREPSDEELQICRDHVKSADNRQAAIEDIIWTLVNRTEFLQRN